MLLIDCRLEIGNVGLILALQLNSMSLLDTHGQVDEALHEDLDKAKTRRVVDNN